MQYQTHKKLDAETQNIVDDICWSADTVAEAEGLIHQRCFEAALSRGDDANVWTYCGTLEDVIWEGTFIE